MEQKYASWRVDSESRIAYLNQAEGPQVPLRTDGNIAYVGEWGSPDRAKNLLSGICLFDARWQVEFAPESGNQPGRKTLALPMERGRAYRQMDKGQTVRKIYCPVEPGPYHERLIAWQAERFRALDPEKILYHIPRMEYHAYISVLEEKLKRKLPQVRECLEIFVVRIRERLFAAMAENGLDSSRLFLVEPMRMGADDPEESYLLPYVAPEKLGVKPSDLLAVEDLVELKLSLLAEEKCGYRIPVILGILAMPHPFLSKELAGGIAIIELH